jgi:hypothetical protein
VEGKGNHAAATVYLDKLAEELTNRGLEAWLMAPPGRVPSVYITNPRARALEENVCANQGKDGLWWFWWSWAERISIADDLDTAASTISRVLSLPRGRDLLLINRWCGRGRRLSGGHARERGRGTAPGEGPVR